MSVSVVPTVSFENPNGHEEEYLTETGNESKTNQPSGPTDIVKSLGSDSHEIPKHGDWNDQESQWQDREDERCGGE
ncbi:hypothetical protein CA85_07600 [Allorhodopirellula solitaria]|uniref:Uncharacterized protein n=1 Tax=Allorhodopirellula solitaria TaxID=2527987 RepID=A0A5C5YFS3_9BACT|nr:hypothetical protein [Allorhodopirellula solitaria]TWT73878.1 hypothetical protein CA85_07600 [Allorhodopirellula solitaria]